MLSKLNRIDEARNDTLIHKAPLDVLPNLSLLYGLEWLNSNVVTDEAQRAFLQATLYGVRGTYTGFFSSVRALFSYGEIKKENVKLTRELNTAFLTGAGLNTYWGLDRFIEIIHPDGTRTIARSTHSETVNNVFRVYLSSFTTASHKEERLYLPNTDTVTLDVILLPFRILEKQPSRRGISNIEKPCEVILELFENILVDIPTSYYRENGDARTLDPQGLHIMTLSQAPLFADRLSGPFPLYYDVGNTLSEFIRQMLDKLLASGVKLTAIRRVTP